MQSVSPVFGDDEVQFEKVIALDQPEYTPIIALPITFNLETPEGIKAFPNMGMSVRFRLSDEERAKIAAGADLILTELVFDKPFTPINFQLCQPDEKPAY